jgi:hypothetical protein
MKKTLISALFLVACLAAPGLEADSGSAVYLLAGLDGKMLTNQDANNYFNLSGQQLGAQGYPSPVVHLGVRMLDFLAVELSANFGPNRNNDVVYENFASTTRRVTTHWGLTTYSITPGFTWAGGGFISMLGLRVGQAVLNGHVDDNAYGQTGSYDQEAQTYDAGLIFRSSQMIVNHVSLGLELGYDWTMFKDIKNKNGKGTYDPVHSPERNVSNFAHNGDQTTLDFSGGHLAIVMGLWSNPAVAKEEPSAQQAKP